MAEPCPACGDRGRGKSTFRRGRWRVRSCRSCGHGVTEPPPTREELEALYDAPEYFRDRGMWVEQEHLEGQRERVRLVQRLAPGPRLLDVGSGSGTFLAAAEEAGFQGVGVEVSAPATERARERFGLDVRQGPLEASRFREDERFDVVTMFHVLEHLPDPVGALRLVLTRLRPGGHLVVEVPNPGSPTTYLSPRVRKCVFELPAHLHHFTEESLALMMTAGGFGVEWIQPSIPEWIDEALGWLGKLRRRRGTGVQDTPGTPEAGAGERDTPGARLVRGVRRWLPGYKLTAVGRVPDEGGDGAPGPG